MTPRGTWGSAGVEVSPSGMYALTKRTMTPRRTPMTVSRRVSTPMRTPPSRFRFSPFVYTPRHFRSGYKKIIRRKRRGSMRIGDRFACHPFKYDYGSQQINSDPFAVWNLFPDNLETNTAPLTYVYTADFTATRQVPVSFEDIGFAAVNTTAARPQVTYAWKGFRCNVLIRYSPSLPTFKLEMFAVLYDVDQLGGQTVSAYVEAALGRYPETTHIPFRLRPEKRSVQVIAYRQLYIDNKSNQMQVGTSGANELIIWAPEFTDRHVALGRWFKKPLKIKQEYDAGNQETYYYVGNDTSHKMGFYVTMRTKRFPLNTTVDNTVAPWAGAAKEILQLKYRGCAFNWCKVDSFTDNLLPAPVVP